MPEFLSALLDASALSQLPIAWALAGMLLLALLASTLLPLGSEAAFVLLLHSHPEWQAAIWLAATVGNTLGGAISYGMGRGAHRLLQPHAGTTRISPRAVLWLQRHGPLACVLSWLPGIGDPLCAMAGWLRLPALSCIAWMAIGKGARYAALLLLGS